MTTFYRRLTYWLQGGPLPPQVHHPEEIKPIFTEAKLMLECVGPISPQWGRREIEQYVNDSITDRELQAHALKHLQEKCGIVIDRSLNPNLPEPAYFDRKGRIEH